MRISKDNLQIALDRFIRPLNRYGYIRSSIGGEDWKFIPSWLTDSLVESHLNQKLYVGTLFPERNGERWTGRITLDCDKGAVQVEYYLELMEDVTGLPAPSFTFSTPFSGGCHLQYFLDRTMNEKEIKSLKFWLDSRALKDGIPRAEFYPCRKAIRVPLGKGSYLIDRMDRVIFEDVNNSLHVIGDLWDRGKIDIVQVPEFRDWLRTNKSNRKVFYSDTGGFWEKVRRAETSGITEQETRNQTLLTMIRACYLRKQTFEETTETCLDWLRNKVSPLFSKDVRAWKERQFRAEIRAEYRRCERTFDPAKRRFQSLSLVYQEKELILGAVADLGLKERRGRGQRKSGFQSVFDLASKIYGACKFIKSRDIYISHRQFDRWGYYQESKKGRFDAVRVLKEAGYLKIKRPSYFIPGAPGAGRCTLYCFALYAPVSHAISEDTISPPLIKVIALPEGKKSEKKGGKESQGGSKGSGRATPFFIRYFQPPVTSFISELAKVSPSIESLKSLQLLKEDEINKEIMVKEGEKSAGGSKTAQPQKLGVHKNHNISLSEPMLIEIETPGLESLRPRCLWRLEEST